MAAENVAPVLRQAVHDVVRTLLKGVPVGGRGSTARHESTARPATQDGAGEMTDPGDRPAADLAALFGVLAVGGGQRTPAVLNSWFPEIPPPDTTTPHPADTGGHEEDLDLDGRQEPSSGMARR